MTKYVVDLAIGDWSTSMTQTEHAGESVLASGDDPADAYALAGAELEWSMDGEQFPSQPTPTQLKLQLYVPDIATGPEPRQGQVVAFTLSTEDYQRNRLRNSNLRVNEFAGYTPTRMTLARVQDSSGRWHIAGTVSDASVTTSGSQRISTPTAPIRPGETARAAIDVQPSGASGLTQVTGRIIFVGADGLELAVGNGATAASLNITSASFTRLEVPSVVAPADAAGFRIRVFLPTSQNALVGLGDVLRVRDPFLFVAPAADPLMFNLDNLEPVATFDGRLADVDAAVFRDGLVYDLIAVDYVSELAEVTIGDEPWPEEFVQRYEPVGFPDSWEAGRYVRIAQLASESSVSALNVTENPTATFSDQFAATMSGDPLRAGDSGTFGGLSTCTPRDVDSQPASDLLAELLRQVVMVVNPERKMVETYVGAQDQFTDDDALPYYLTPIMGQGVDELGNVSVFPVWVTDRILDNGHALVASWGVDDVLRLLDKHVDSIIPGVAMHVPASVVDRDDVTWRMDKAVSPNTYRENYTGEALPGETVPGFIRDIFDVTLPAPQTYSWKLTGYWVAHGPLVMKNGAVQVLVEGQSTQDYYGTFRWVPILGRYYDAQPVYMVDQLTLYPARLDEGIRWPRLFAHRNPYGYWSGHLGRWVFIHGIDDRWNPHPNGLYYGQLTGAQLQIQDGGKIVMGVQLRHRQPGAVGDSGALHLEDLPAGVTAANVDPAIRFVDLSVTSRTVEEL